MRRELKQKIIDGSIGIDDDADLHEMLKSDAWKKYRSEIFADIKKELPQDVVPSIKDFLKMLMKVSEGKLGLAVISPEAHEMFSEYMAFCYGNKVYDFHPNLISKLNVTNIKSVPSEFLRLPFKTVSLRLPKGAISFEAYKGSTLDAEDIIISEIAAHTNEVLNEHDAIKILVRNPPYFCYFTILLSEDEVHMCVESTIKSINEEFKNNKGEKDFSDIFNAQNDLPKAVKEDYLRQIEDNKHFTEGKQGQVRLLFEFIMKCILYINGANADVYWYDESDYLRSKMERVKSPKKKKKIASMIKKSGVYKAGHRIVLSREEKELYNGIKNGRWKISTRFLVQGHYRSQPYGEDRQKRKVIFIEPFYKGPEYAELINNNEHIVKV